jgi:hypothetical protein
MFVYNNLIFFSQSKETIHLFRLEIGASLKSSEFSAKSDLDLGLDLDLGFKICLQ